MTLKKSYRSASRITSKRRAVTAARAAPTPTARSFIVVLALVERLLSARPAEACSCAEAASPEAELVRADAVFVATITSVQRSERRKIVEVKITRAFKGVHAGASISIHTGAGGGDCGIGFTPGSSWLVYTARSSALLYAEPGYGGLSTIPCSRTTPLDQAKQDIDALGAAISGDKAKAPANAASSDLANTEPAPASSSISRNLPLATAASTTVPTTAPSPQSKGCACDAGAAAQPLPYGWLALALLATLARRRGRWMGTSGPHPRILLG